MAKRATMTSAKRRMFELDAKTINFYRRNPVIACEDLLGIYLSDAQSWLLASTWNTESSVWACSRNFGKSFLIAVYTSLRAVLYPNQNIYIISSVGNQAKETFTKIEEIATRSGRTAESIPDLKDILQGEVVTTGRNTGGFKHDPTSYEVEFYNGSKIFTLNSKPSNIRGKRSNLNIYDEAAFIADDLITATQPFTAQDSSAKYSADAARDKDTDTRQPYNQTIFASSQDTLDTVFYKNYKEYAKHMLAGNKRYFVADMPCDTAITMYRQGKEIAPLLSRDKVNDELRKNPDKARREYYNKPDLSGSNDQVIKWGTIRKNERQIIPHKSCTGNKIILAFDPARTFDNSIVSAMELIDDPELGVCGAIVGCDNLIDIGSSKKLKLDSNRQIEKLRNIILQYNGDNPDYEYIDSICVDSGSGGGGLTAYSDNLLNNWVDKHGNKHKGLIDAKHDVYVGYRSRYPEAVDKLRLLSPLKYRNQMIEEFIELMDLGVIWFPHDYNGQDFLKIDKGVDPKTKEEILETYILSQDEIIALNQIDLMKTEITSIHKHWNAEKTKIQYALAKEKQNTMHDDRFYTAIMLAHRLYEIRRGNVIRKRETMTNVNNFISFRAPKIGV